MPELRCQRPAADAVAEWPDGVDLGLGECFEWVGSSGRQQQMRWSRRSSRSRRRSSSSSSSSSSSIGGNALVCLRGFVVGGCVYSGLPKAVRR